MPFLNEITGFINQTLKAGSLNKKVLQPAIYYGLSSVVMRKANATQKTPEQLPAIVTADGKVNAITPDSKIAIQVYHRLVSNVYGAVKKSYGNSYDLRCSSEVAMVVIVNSKLTGKTKDVLEPVILFGMPQGLSAAMLAELKIISCLITPLSSNMDQTAVFKQEFPQADYFLTTNMSMFSIRYKIDMTFSQACVDHCLCDDNEISNSHNIVEETGINIVTEDAP